MKKIAITMLMLFAQTLVGFGQSDSLQIIDAIAGRIDAMTNLTVKEFDASEVYGRAFDGGGTFKIYLNNSNSEIRKVEEEIGLSFGRVATTIYFANGKPIKIIDREESFAMKADQTTLDYSKLSNVFTATIYVFDWDKDRSHTIIKGKRNLSEGSCAIFEYEGTIEMAKKLVVNTNRN